MVLRDSGMDKSLSGVRDISAARCAVALRDHGTATVADIARHVGLSRPTVESGLAAMVDRGLVVDTDGHTAGGRGVGRPAKLFEFHAVAGYVVGVDVGVHRIRVAIADLAGSVVAWNEESVSGDLNGAARMALIKEMTRRTIARADLALSRIVTMTVAVSGMVAADGRLISSVLLTDWEGVDIAGHLRAEFGCAVFVENDMRLAALAEHRLGTAQLMEDVVFFFAGHRIATGLILGGELRRGHHSAAGEIGDMVFGELLDKKGALMWTSAPTGEEVFGRAASGDPDSRAEVERFVEVLAAGIAIVAMTIDPDMVVVGGGLSRAGEILLGPLQRAINERIKVPVSPTLKSSELGAESVVLGALVLASSEAAEIVFGVRGLPEPMIDVARAREVFDAELPGE